MKRTINMTLMTLEEWRSKTQKTQSNKRSEIKKRRQMAREQAKVEHVVSDNENKNDPLKKLNEATVEELCQIKGVGPKIANKIQAGQPYDTLSDLTVSSTVKKRLKEWVAS